MIVAVFFVTLGRTPLRGAWIEMIVTTVVDAIKSVAPRSGVRGLKCVLF